jgi:hypothetical protein
LGLPSSSIGSGIRAVSIARVRSITRFVDREISRSETFAWLGRYAASPFDLGTADFADAGDETLHCYEATFS